MCTYSKFSSDKTEDLPWAVNSNSILKEGVIGTWGESKGHREQEGGTGEVSKAGGNDAKQETRGRREGLSIYKWKHEKTTLFGATKNSAAKGSGVLSGLALLSPSRRVESMGRELAAWEASRSLSWEGGGLGDMEWVGQEEEQSGNYFLHCLTKNGQGR